MEKKKHKKLNLLEIKLLQKEEEEDLSELHQTYLHLMMINLQNVDNAH